MSGSILFLYGPSGTGKSTIGRQIARNLDLPFYDLDQEIELDIKKPVWQIFADEGEAGFRLREASMLVKLIGIQPGIIALGGGTLLAQENRTAVEAAGQVVVLEAPLHVMHDRLKNDKNQRPLLAGELVGKLENLLEIRAEHYHSFSHHLNTGELSPEQAAWQVQVQAGMFRIKGMGSDGAGTSGAYDVRIRPGGLNDIGSELAARGLTGPLVLVTDDTVGPLYASRVLNSVEQSGFTAASIQIPAGEDHKTIETVIRLWEFFLANQLDRSSTVIALGGGVVSDLAGFAAATYLRGIRWVGLPTTLLAMADASLGGKTGADLPQGKNLIGAFHAPQLVLADPDVLSTLPDRELRGGFAEIVKHGVISDPVLFEACKGLAGLSVEEIRQKPLSAIIRRAMAVKILVIEQDPFEKGIRAILNAGHTVGHAVELVSNFKINHGEAVSIGMVVEARMAEERGLAREGLADEIEGVLTGLGLPTRVPVGMDREAVETALFRDKKRAGSGVKFALPKEISQAEFGVNFTQEDIRRSHAFSACFTRS
jgi:shikimate kinase / 3-dehydroquinate synthase